jgi:hypothetical protein
MPDLRGEVVRWGATHDGVLVELALRGTLSGRAVAWTTVDRIVLRGGLIAARRSYFDPLPLIGALLSRPQAALKLLPRPRPRGRADTGVPATARRGARTAPLRSQEPPAGSGGGHR